MITLASSTSPWKYTPKDDMPTVSRTNDLYHSRFVFVIRFQCSLEDFEQILKQDFDSAEIDGVKVHARVSEYDPTLMGEDGICTVMGYLYHDEIIESSVKQENTF